MKAVRKRRKIAATFGVALCIAFCIAVASVAALSSSGGGEWGYQRELVMYDQSGETLTDYQVLVELTGSNFPTNAQTDGDDIRFTDSSGTELSYWIEEWDYGAEEATIWMKVPSIPASGETTITMWYGNPSAGVVSDGDVTFEFFDDFEDGDISDWDITVVSSSHSIVDESGNLYQQHKSSKAGPTSCGSNCYRDHRVDMEKRLDLPTKTYIVEIYGRETACWGYCLCFYIDGTKYIFDPQNFCYNRADTTQWQWLHSDPLTTPIGMFYLERHDQTSAGFEEIDVMRIRQYTFLEPTVILSAEESTTKTPSLTLTKSVSPSTIEESETTTITVKVGNRGSADATNVEVTDSVPVAFALVSGSLTQSYDTLKPTEYRTYQYTIEATETGSFVADVATATYEDDEGNSYSSASNSVTITVESETTPTPSTPTPTTPTPSTPTPSTPTPTLTPTPSTPNPTSEPKEEPELSISQSSLKEEPEVGEEVLITVAILNKGKATAKNIRLVENIPSSIAVNYVEGGDKAGSLVYWNGELDSGEAHSITHTLRILEEKNRIIPVTVTYEDASGTEHQQSAEIYLTAETPTQPSTDSTPAFELPDLSWPYLIILVAVVFGGIAIIVAVKRKGGDGGAEVTIEEKGE